MIRLNQHIERWRRHPLIGPVLILLVVVVMALVAIHEGHEALDTDVGALCVGLVFILLAAITTLLRPPAATSRRVVLLSRGPPRQPSERPANAPLVPSCLPLRL